MFFRAEDHLQRWLDDGNRARGATIDLPTAWALGQAWFGDCLAPDWRPRSRDSAQKILDRLGLTGAFWQLG